jgi:hypothetical protein
MDATIISNPQTDDGVVAPDDDELLLRIDR